MTVYVVLEHVTDWPDVRAIFTRREVAEAYVHESEQPGRFWIEEHELRDRLRAAVPVRR